MQSVVGNSVAGINVQFFIQNFAKMIRSENLPAVLLLAIICVSSVYGNIPPPTDTIYSEDDLVFMLGKYFLRNGKPQLPSDATEPEWYSQCMDHFNSSGCQTKWNQRYWVLEDYYQEGGPIFFQFGGEGPADALIDNYYWHNYARNMSAMMIVLEHRFYGESWPSEDNSLEILQLLTSQQALADAAYFIDEFKETRGLQDSQWVAFGCSYAGNLAAWMKQKYPNHVKTAVASSGPVLAIYDFPGYIETVSEVVRDIDRDCYNRVFDAFNCMESLVNGSVCADYTHTSEILPALQQCYSVDFGNLLSRETFFLNLGMGQWAGNWPSPAIRRNCDLVRNVEEPDPLKAYGNFLVAAGSGGSCFAKGGGGGRKQQITSEEEFTKFIQSKEGRMAGAAGWFWQTCYEFGYYMSADPINGLFGFDTWSGWPYGVQCAGQFGEKFTKAYTEDRIALTNEFYKGRDIDSKCVIFVNGAWDPWHTLSINRAEETSSDNKVIYVPQAEHCDDVLSPKSDEMREAQEQIRVQIGLYLDDPKC